MNQNSLTEKFNLNINFVSKHRKSAYVTEEMYLVSLDCWNSNDVLADLMKMTFFHKLLSNRFTLFVNMM